MTRMDLDFAIIATVRKKLDDENDPPAITPDDVLATTRRLEAITGVAVLNNFHRDDVERFLKTKCAYGEHIFIETAMNSNEYVVNSAAIRYDRAYPNKILCLLDILDPRLNYPMEVIEASGILPDLETDD